MSRTRTAALRFTVRPHRYLTLAWRDVLAALPPMGAQDGKGDEAIAYVKFFDPCGSWTWFATEAVGYTAAGDAINPSEFPKRDDIEDVNFFGLVHGHERELGYFSLRELADVNGPLRIGIERDCWFTPRPLSTLNQRGA